MEPAGTERLSRIFIGIVITEALAIAALYWFGAYFS